MNRLQQLLSTKRSRKIMKDKLATVLSVSLLALLASCGGMKLISQQKDLSAIYGNAFLKKISSIKSDYGQGKKNRALSELKALEKSYPESKHRALIKNLFGVMSFQDKKYDKAIGYFKEAVSLKTPDESLTAQANLNLASSYYKKKDLPSSLKYFELVTPELLEAKEQKKYYHLGYTVTSKVKGEEAGLKYLVHYLSDYKTVSDLKQSPLLEKLTQNYMNKSYSEKIRFLEEFDGKESLVVPYLGYLEAERLYHSGNKASSKDVLDWINNKYPKEKEIARLTKGLEFKMANFSKINPNAIGIVLPLSHPRNRKFAKRAMLGIDMAFRDYFKKSKSSAPTLHIKDSHGSPIVGATRVKELIEKQHVSVIIGGLLPKEATREYLEAKKYGVMFISLSPIYLPRLEKSHLLVEVSGSVESIIGRILSSDMVKKFGKKAALLYPNSDSGKTYMNEFWDMARKKNVKVVAVQSYQKNLTDYRGPVKNILSLNYKRERKEELDIYNKIHSLQKKSSIRRVQTLGPVLDFDWIFVPANPQEALQIIPSFSYFDALKVNFVGIPSWQSGTFVKRAERFNPLYVMGGLGGKKTLKFKKNFSEKFKRKARLIETISYEGMSVVANILQTHSFTTRDELELYMIQKGEINGITGSWKYDDGLWIKKMIPLKIHRGKAETLFNDSESANSSYKEVFKRAM